jgi:hypothetical protein
VGSTHCSLISSLPSALPRFPLIRANQSDTAVACSGVRGIKAKRVASRSLSHIQDLILMKPMTLSITVEFRCDAEEQTLHPDAFIRILSKREA